MEPKKLLILYILEILQRYSDEDHRLTQQDIIARLVQDYDMPADRKAVKRNLDNLIAAGHPIDYDEIPRSGQSLTTNYYLAREFSDPELCLLIDGVLFAKHIPGGQRRQLAEKLAGLSSAYFQYSSVLPGGEPRNRELFYTIETLNEAIAKGRQVGFCYGSYGIDKQLRPRTDAAGQPREFRINPYRTANANGRYYLICNHDKYDDVIHYRVDRIMNIRLLDSPAKSMKQVKGLEHGLHLPEHMAEHLYMFPGESVRVKFLANRSVLDDIFDWFGMDVRLSEVDSDTVRVTAMVNENAMVCWATQYGPYVEVLEPKALRARLREDILAMAEKYVEEV